jgi:hypothetical protein
MDAVMLESDIAYMELNHTIDSFNDYCIIQSFYEDTDDKSEKTDNLLVKIQKKLKALVDKIKEVLSRHFNKQKVENPSEKAYDETLNKLKVKALDTKKLYGLTKSYKEKIMKAKSEDEIREIVRQYKQAENGCFCVVTGVAAIAIARHSNKLIDALDRDSSYTLYRLRRTHDKEAKKELNKRIDRNDRSRMIHGAVRYSAQVYAFVTLVPMMASAISQIFSSAMKRVEKNAVETNQEVNKEISKAGPSLGYVGKTPKAKVYKAETYKPDVYKPKEYETKKYETKKYKPDKYKVKKYETKKYKAETYKPETYKPEVYQSKK